MDQVDFVSGATTKAVAKADVAANSDRRRPGRTEASAELIPLLRVPEGLHDDRDDTAPVRGIAAGLAFSLPIYAGIWFTARYLFF